MQGSFLVEIFKRDFSFLSKAVIEEQKIEFDYMSIENNELKVPGYLEAYKKSFVQITTEEARIQGVIDSVEYTAKETKIKYKVLLSIIDVEVYKDRTALSDLSAEQFLGEMIEETFVNNPDELQNILGLAVEYLSETTGAALNLTENIHNIYELSLKVFRKYGIVVEMEFDATQKSLVCRIGKRELETKTIEAELKNVLEASVVLKDDDESVNKVVIIGEYNEDDPLFGQTLARTFYLDKATGETTQTPTERVEPVVFRYKVLTIDAETFEEDAYEEAYDLTYKEECDNSIKIKVGKADPLYQISGFEIGQPCVVIKKGVRYATIFTGWTRDKVITLLFGLARVEYTKKIRRKG